MGWLAGSAFARSRFSTTANRDSWAQTKYPVRKMVRFALDAITAFSIKPLRLASMGGAITALLGLVLGAYSVASYLRGSAVTGWTSLMTVMTFLSSVQLFVLGVFGEYLGRLYEQMKGRPLFIIEQIVRTGEDNDRGSHVGNGDNRSAIDVTSE